MPQHSADDPAPRTQTLHERYRHTELLLQRVRSELQACQSQGDIEGSAMAQAELQRLGQQQEMIAGRLAAQRHQPTVAAGCIGLGSTVWLHTPSGERCFTLVDSLAADPSADCISPQSPLGQVLMGRRAGDKVSLELPGSLLHCTVLQVD